MAETTKIRRAYLHGDTYQIRAVLKDRGWKWDAEQKVWYKDEEWEDEAEVIRVVRLYPHVRNRGNFRATLHAI